MADVSGDEDGDGVPDVQDAFCFDEGESVDTDDDGMGNNADTDDDADGIADVNDPAPLVGSSNIPTDGRPSPLFGAGDFDQQLLLFEEFGTDSFAGLQEGGFVPFPPPQDPQHGPDPGALEAFLEQPAVSPLPGEFAADEATYLNPWQAEIEAFLGRALDTPPADGRPQGIYWSHQRYAEFYPQRFFKTTLAGARVNRGFRDARQRHGYALGEFGPGGLYHTVYTSSVPGAPTLTATTAGLPIQIHPKLPVQDPNSVWTFDGTLPPKLLVARHGEATLMRNYNALPIDEAANYAPTADPNFGFGRHTITTHEHNGHSPGESDGFAGAYFFPGQFYDYRWPLQLAGYDTINTNASEPRAALPCEPGETVPVDDDGDGVPTPKQCADRRNQLRGDWRETMSTHWFHDHMLDHTAENVYKGNAVMMNYYSALDRGNEAVNDGVNLRFPSGTALPWGNRDYDVNLLVGDKAWDQQGQLWYNVHNHDGYLGDRLLTNWLWRPYLDVRARRYRFRILNGAVSRIMSFALVQQVQGDAGEMPGPAGSGVSYNRVPFHMIANDGNVMEHAVPFDGTMDLDGDGDLLDHKGHLPSQSIAERYDIVVDFKNYQSGTKLYFVNVLEHQDGKGSKRKVPLAEILSEEYKPEISGDRWVNGDPCVGKFLELRVHPYAGQDLSMDPADYVSGKQKMIPLKLDRENPADQALLAQAVHHTFAFVRSQGGSETPWQIRVDGGATNPMDPHRVAALERGALEIWRISGNKGWTHPVHIHFEEGIILTRGGKAPPEWEKWARKDMYRVGPEEDSDSDVEIAIQAREFVGTFVEHCHNTMHEDHAMLLRWDGTREDLGTITLAPTPMPGWDGVVYEPSIPWETPSTINNGDGTGPVFDLP
ncbi:MAG: multicopper oxidase domain-containing protein [Deltaproteobacteria bacterium]|nr:multicopper oxidase domain-containing protein [Deltaproteobacteria bacterium]